MITNTKPDEHVTCSKKVNTFGFPKGGLGDFLREPRFFLNPQTQYILSGNYYTGKCIFWKYIVEVELSKLTYVEDKIIISPSFLCISVIFLQRAMVHYTILKTMLLYLLKVYPSLCISARNEGIVLAFFGIFSRKSTEINLKR